MIHFLIIIGFEGAFPMLNRYPLLTFILIGFFFLNSNAAVERVLVQPPVGSNLFAEKVIILANGNFLVLDGSYTGEGASGRAVHLYHGRTLQRISSLT